MKLISLKRNTPPVRTNPELLHFKRKRLFFHRLFNFRKFLAYVLFFLILYAVYLYVGILTRPPSKDGGLVQELQ